MGAWRWRKCPACGVVLPAGQLIQVQYGSHWVRGYSLRQCPQCGRRGRTSEFQVVREKHPA